MRPGLTISVVGHVVALGFGLIAISATPMEVPPVDSLPVSFISDKDFSQMTQGVKNAPKPKDNPKPLADKIDLPKPADQAADKVAKQEVKTETAPPKQQPQPDPKPAEKQTKPNKPPPDYKPDEISQLLKKDADKQQPKPQDKPAPDKSTKDAPKFDANQVAQLLDHRDVQRQMASADVVNQTPGAGSATGTAAQLSQSEIDALRARISSCWSPPPGIDVNTKLYIVLDVQFKPDANMSREPVIVEGSASSLGPALAESAKRALLKCQPFTMLKPEHYGQWKDLQLKFDPQELLGG
jgi:outer membrane biosynthesis protein TonB